MQQTVNGQNSSKEKCLKTLLHKKLRRLNPFNKGLAQCKLKCLVLKRKTKVSHGFKTQGGGKAVGLKRP